MESIGVANVHRHQRSAEAAKKKNKKRKKKPIKVVYISNPMKFKTSANEFRALVQELTGQDSDPTKFLDPDFNGVVGPHQTEDQPPPSDNIAGSKIEGDDDDDNDQVFLFEPTTTADSPTPPPPPPPPPPHPHPVLLAEPFDEYDDAFMALHHHHAYKSNKSGFLFSDFSSVDLIYETT